MKEDITKPIVSVILPNRNYADFIADAIMSVKTQTLSNIECIIIDDNSDDNSAFVIKDLIRGDDRFKFIQFDETRGISAARNAGLDIANGEYIAFLDSDDCYTVNALELLVNAAEKENLDIVGGKTKFVDAYFRYNPNMVEKSASNQIKKYKDIIEMFMAGAEYKWIWIWRRVYKRSFIGDLRFPEEMRVNGDDISFMLDLSWKLRDFKDIENITIYHRIHPLSITAESQDFNLERVKIFTSLFDHVKNDLMGKYDRKFFKKLYGHLFNYLLGECVVKTVGKAGDENKDFLRNILRDSCRKIPKKYLSFKQKILCWYLSWLR